VELSPISDQALETLAHQVAGALRRVLRRAPPEVKSRARETLEDVFRVVEGGTPDPPRRIDLVRAMEGLDAELRGREAFVTEFYRDGRLGITRAFYPVKIRWAVRHQWLSEQSRRYEQRIQRSQARLAWLYRRVGWEVEAATARKPWELPYADLEQDREFLWGRKVFGG
jgi:hypothetical protein